jgi:F0F1-type ATP synthase assembly protein I
MAREGLALSDFLSLGAGLAALLVAGMGLGWLADSLANTFPIFVLVGLGLGIVGACTYAVSQFRKFLSSSQEGSS